MKQSRIREWQDNNHLINFEGALIRRKKQEKLKIQDRDLVINLKLVLIRRNIQHFTGMVL